MKIGIVTRKSLSSSGKNINIIYSNIYKKIRELNVICYGIILDKNYEELLNCFDGIIFEGGNTSGKYDLLALKYLYDKDIPTLGICLGMQDMAILFDGEEERIEGHLNINHDVYINKNSKLFEIYNRDIINVNSRHKYKIKTTSLEVSAKDLNGNIEAVEDKSKKFFIGVQWHPEDIDDDIFKYFIRGVKDEN